MRDVVQLNFLLKKHVMIRRLKDDVLTQLQPKQRTAVMVTIDDPEVERICKRLTELRMMAQKLVDSNSQSTAGLLSGFSAETRATLFEMFKKTGESKLSAVLQYLSDLLENDQKFLVFAHHLSVLDGIEQFLKANNANYFRLDGSTSAADRQAGVDRFQTDSRCRVALLSITAGGTGITLTASSTVVFAELQFTPALLLQAEDRVHRIGQPNAVNIHYLLGRHSLDDLLWPLLVKKLQVLGTTLNGEEDEMEFEDVRGEAASGQQFKKGNAMTQWLQREEQRKAEQAKKAATQEARKRERWKDAIQVDSDDEDFSTPPSTTSRPPTPSAEGDEEVEPRDSLWVYLSGDDDDDGFIVEDEEEEAVDEGEAEAKFDGEGGEEEEGEEEEDDEADRKYDSDSSFAPDDGEVPNAQPEDEDDGEAEYGEEQQPVQRKKQRRRVLRSDDDEVDGDAEVEEVEQAKGKAEKRRRPSGRRTPTSTFPSSSLTPPSSTSSSSSSSAEAARDRSPWASVFGMNLQTIEEETAHNHRKLTASQRTAQRRNAERSSEERGGEEEEEQAAMDEDAAISASPAARAGVGDAGSSGLMSEGDLCLMLVGMDFNAATVKRVLRGMARGAKKGKGGEALIDINQAIERLTSEPAQPQPTVDALDDGAEEEEEAEAPPSRRTRAKARAEEEAEAVPCEKCGASIPFLSYSEHLSSCGTSEQQPQTQTEGQSTGERRSGSAFPADGAAEGGEEEEEEVKEMAMRSRGDRRRSRLIDLEDAEEVEEQIVTNEDSVDSVGGVEWVPE